MNILNIPHSILVMAASLAFAFVLGVAVGNVHATRTIVAQIQAHEDARFAAATGAISEELKRRNVVVQKDAELARVSDMAALDAMSVDLSKAEGARIKALAQLDHEHKSKMEIVDAYMAAINIGPAVSACGYSGSARRMLNEAAGAAVPDRAAGAKVADPDTARGTVAPDAPAPSVAADSDWLSCDDLYRGYVALGSWAREKATPRVQAWEAWYRSRFGARP